MKRFWIASLLALSCLACEDDGGKPHDVLDAGLDASTADDAGADASAADDASVDAAVANEPGDLERDYCAPLAQLICERADACGCGVVVPGGELDTPGCTARWTGKCMASYAGFVAAIESGKASVVRAAASECIAMITTLTPECQRPSGLISFALCRPLVVSETALGATCADVPYCAGGDGLCLEGSCTPRLALGAACENEYACQTGLACFEGKCQALGGAASACTIDPQCEPPLRCVGGRCASLASDDAACTDTSACEQGLVCSDAVCGMGASSCDADAACGNLSACAAPRTCQPRLGENEACSSDRACSDALFCGPEQRCIARPVLGEACGNGSVCAAGLACLQSDQGEATCGAQPGLGQACALDAQGPFVCAEGLGCVDNVCAALPSEGEACAGNYRCAAGLACDFTAEGSFCVAPKALGAPCQNDVVCGAAGHCGPSGTCEADQPDGTPCRAGNECAGICGPDATGGLSCRARPASDEACLFDEDCADESACRSNPATQRCVPEICREL